ncbi:MAG: leucine-rich repeat domain-containing protein [Lachnospiraceae bacterium]|nr:leucine-rich repeat domain-containing protein [Lachnospiraceae bacterium]
MSENIKFIIEDGILKKYLAPDPEVDIPEGVHTIGDGVFKGMSWITKVKLPSTLKKIGEGAFKGCRQLKNMDFPSGLTEIGEYAFHRCHSIEEMIFPISMTRVGSHAFLYCDGLKKVVMEGPIHLGRAVFSHNMSLEEISLNRELDDSNFADEVFEGCICLRKISLSGKVYEVDNLIKAMNSTSAFPGVIKSIAKSVYHSLQIEDGILYTFNINLKTISLPEGIKVIGKGCFFDKKGIVSITLPESLNEIRANAFLNCVSLEEITVKNENILLDDKAFRGCCNLKRVNISGKTYMLEDEPDNELASRIRDQILGDFYISGKILVRYMGDEEQIKLPKEVEIIGERCFFGNERLKVVTCPENLTEIREQAFEGCVALQNVILSDKLKRVEREAFAECKKMLKCNLPVTVEYVGKYAFRRCYTLPVFDPWPKNAELDPYAFFKSKNFASIEEKLKKEDKKLKTQKDEQRYKDETKNAGDMIDPYAYSRDEDIKVLKLSGVKRIGEYAYAMCNNLEEIEIDSTECVIEDGAFSGCNNLRKVSLRVKKLGTGIFSYCRKLKEVCISGVSVLPDESFAGCYDLNVFEAKEVSDIGTRCFDECSGLESFDFKGIKVIGERAFERCDSLKSIELGALECGFHAFADCSGLESVKISDDTDLKSGAFIGCTQMRNITYDSQKYEFSKFADSLNHVGNPYPVRVREVIASVYSCFEIRDRKVLTGYLQDSVKVTIPQDIEEIGQDVFRDRNRLKEIIIPESVKIFGPHAFSQTTWLTACQEKNEFVIVNDVLLDGTKCRGMVVIPDSVKRIAGWCFAGNICIKELKIPSERIIVETLSFRNCLNLKKITDWDGNEYTLDDVADLSEKEYPDLVRRIFSECINCFKLDGEGKLEESTGNITNLTFPSGIKSVGEGVYKDCHLLENIALSPDTKKIGKSAFENSKWLKKVTKAQAIESIGALAFSGCQSLECIELSDALCELGNRCFEHCVSLREINLSDRLQKIPERAFFRCKSLKKIVIPASVKVIEAEAFAFCDGLEEVYISENTQISENAFAFCDHVKVSLLKA